MKSVKGEKGSFSIVCWVVVAMLLLSTFGTSAGVLVTNLHSFRVPVIGANPKGALLQASDGNLYGTTTAGGTNTGGTVFKISGNGTVISLYSFTGSNDGATPHGGLIQASDGNLYGTTVAGGINNYGTVFKISTNGALYSLYSFTGGNDGAEPYGGLVRASDGNLYGTTSDGGTNEYGTVFKISTNGALSSLYSFTAAMTVEIPLTDWWRQATAIFMVRPSTAGQTTTARFSKSAPMAC